MKIHRLSLFAACILTCAMAIVALAFNYVQEKVIADTQSFYFYLSISLVFIALLNYFVLELLFNSYGKKQIKRISDILPENILQEEENVNFQQLGERIQKNVSEIDMMKEMEDYRKEYIGNVSHELKTPLASMREGTELLADEVAGEVA